MKPKSLLFGLTLIWAASTALAQESLPHERLYISTDKECYLSGENLWLSAFCFDLKTLTSSKASATLYIELQDASYSVEQIKIALAEGRGSGCLKIPLTTPTGTYCLSAYTRYLYAEGEDMIFHKMITIYNPFTSMRSSNVSLVKGNEMTAATAAENDVISVNLSKGTVGLREDFNVEVTNNANEAVSASVSIYPLENLNHYANPSVIEYMESLDKNLLHDVNAESADYAGEVLKAHIVDQDNRPVQNVSGYGTSIAIAGAEIQYYMGKSDEEGNIRFFTSNLYGDGMLVSQVPSIDGKIYRLVVDSAFVSPTTPPLPELYLDPSQEDVLVNRSMLLQLEQSLNLDTLHRTARLSSNPLFRNTGIVYKLDEYTRFPVMRDVIVEFVKEARFRGSQGKHQLQVRINDALLNPLFIDDPTPALVLLDGIPITDHEKIYQYDPALVESITIYPNQYLFGAHYYGGIIFFKTYEGKHQNIELDQSIRVMDFKGVQNPRTFSYVEKESRLPDARHTLYWNPSLSLSSRQQTALPVRSADRKGDYLVVVEGLSKNGTPFRKTCRLQVQ